MIRAIPRSIKVMGQTFKVTVYDHIKDEDGDDILGSCDRDLQTMRLSRDQGPDKAVETMLHEVLHAVLGLAGIGIMAEGVREHEESLVKIMSPILLTTLRDNPRLVEYLVDRPVGGKGASWA